MVVVVWVGFLEVVMYGMVGLKMLRDMRGLLRNIGGDVFVEVEVNRVFWGYY